MPIARSSAIVGGGPSYRLSQGMPHRSMNMNIRESGDHARVEAGKGADHGAIFETIFYSGIERV